MKPKNKKVNVSRQDIKHLALIRKNVTLFLGRAALICNATPGRILEIGPQGFSKIEPLLSCNQSVETLDLKPESGCTYVGDICRRNDCFSNNSFQYVFCTEVLEHTLQPFAAIQEIQRILTSDGLLFLTVPFNFRIHGPLPDCWRFTEYGLRALLADFQIEELQAIETSRRALMPIHYCVVARKT